MSAERDDSVRAAADAVRAGKATKETVDALLGRPHPTADSAIERGPATPENRFAELARLTSAYMDAPEEAMLRRAFEFARDAHAGQCRKSGEPFIIHPIEVGIILADLHMDAETITAALLHDTVEDTKVTAEEVERTFNPQVRALVEGVTKITRIEVESLTDEQAATIRKMFVAMSKDIRVIVIKLADRLHKTREKAAAGFEKHILSTLARLGMPETVFRIALTPLAEPGRTGRDSVQFLFTANPRMTPQPVERIASGGELSRVMLALKALLAERMQLPTIIFDEIDTGVSGRIADAMGEIIASLSASMQVVDITHLPQVASKGTAHFVVYKRGGRTDITRLGDEERVTEIAKMLSGSEITDAAVAQARILLGK